jgi:hypothetical protein
MPKFCLHGILTLTLTLTFIKMANVVADVELDNAIIACCSVNVACAAAVINCYVNIAKLKVAKRKHRVWVRRYLAVRPQFGAYSTLMRDLLELDNTKFRNYIRMDPVDFEELFIVT